MEKSRKFFDPWHAILPSWPGKAAFLTPDFNKGCFRIC